MSNGQFIPTRSSNPCPVCGDIKGKCRQVNDINLCMSFTDSRDISGFKFIGLSKDYLWGKWIIDDGSLSPEERERWIEAKRLERRQREAQERQQRANSLPAPDRDPYYRQLSSQLTLHPTDRDDLTIRLRKVGFTDDEIPALIQAGGFRSVGQWQRLLHELPHTLPGVNLDGATLNTQPGYLCPITDVDGYLIGYQIRLREAEGGRYRWLTSKTKNRENGPRPNLPNGELPLAIHKPQTQVNDIVGLTEGVGAKPFITANRFGQVVIGAAGGQWASSPQQLRHTLETLKARTVVLYPDAGATANPQVMRKYLTVSHLLEEWGYEVQVAWWGQLAKEAPDIDELPPDEQDSIRWIPLEEFQAICAEPIAIRQIEQQIQQIQEELDERSYQKLSRLTHQPWLRINTPKLDLNALNLERGAVYIVSSAKGTHKTNALISFVTQFTNSYAWFSRTALGREECHRIGFQWKDSLKSYSGSLKVGFCSNSAPKFNPAHLKTNGLLLVDEADQVFDHNFGATCNKNGNRHQILDTLQAHLDAALHGGGMALFMSADITDKEVDYIQNLVPDGTPVRLILNDYKPELGTLIFDESDTLDASVNELLRRLEAGIPCFVLDDMKDGIRGCKSIAAFIRKLHPEWKREIVEINADTSGKSDIIEFLRTINQSSQSVRLICCSPSVISGISIQNGRFNQGVFAFLNGVLTVAEASQGIARIRGASEIRVWAAKQGVIFSANRSTDPGDIKAWYHRNYEDNSKFILSFNPSYTCLENEWDSPHFSLFCQNAAYRNACMLKLRERLKARLMEEGYRIETVHYERDKAIQEALKQSWYDIDIAHARAVARAELLSDTELNRYLDSPDPISPEQQAAIEKTLLLQWFGQALIEAMVYEHKSGEVLRGFEAMVLKNRGGAYRRQLEALYLLMSPEDEAIVKDLAGEQRQLEAAGKRFAGDIKWYTLQKKLREAVDLHRFYVKTNEGDPWFEYSEIEALAKRVKSKAARVKDVLKLSVKQMKPGQVFGQLMNQLGLKIERKLYTPKGSDKRLKRYRITEQSWEYFQLYLHYRNQLKGEQTEPLDSPPLPVELGSSSSSESDTADHPSGFIYSEIDLGGDQNSVAHNPVPSVISTLEILLVEGHNLTLETVPVGIEKDGVVDPSPSLELGSSSVAISPPDEVPLTPENIADVIDMLKSCKDSEALGEVHSMFGRSQALWQAVLDGLTPLKQQHVGNWMALWMEGEKEGEKMTSSA